MYGLTRNVTRLFDFIRIRKNIRVAVILLNRILIILLY